MVRAIREPGFQRVGFQISTVFQIVENSEIVLKFNWEQHTQSKEYYFVIFWTFETKAY